MIFHFSMATYWILFFVFITNTSSISVLDIIKSKRDASSRQENEICATHKDAYLNGIMAGEDWALQMLDANGKIPAGILRGANFDFGFYDQCQDINTLVEGEQLKGKYCFAGLVIPYALLLNSSDLNSKATIDKKIVGENIETALAMVNTGIVQPRLDESLIANTEGILLMSACIPDKCMPSDVFGEFGVDFSCETKEQTREFDNADIACLIFLGIILGLLVASTSYDVYLHYSGKKTTLPVLLAFSIYTNSKKVFQTADSRTSNQILCFHGIKTLSMFWVIAGHITGMKTIALFAMDPNDAIDWQKRWYAIYITQGPLAVDSFFFMSGALLSYNFLKTMKKPGAKFNIFMFYLHRYLRLTPALAALYFVVVSIVRRIADGPVYLLTVENQKESCDEKWWSFFLYIQNYIYGENDICLLHTWYLNADMQLYFISPIILFVLLKYPKVTKLFGLPCILFLSILGSFLQNILSQTTPNGFHTHLKISQWLIGIATGVILLRAQKKKINISRRTNLLMWFLALSVMATIIFTLNEVNYINPNKWKSAIYTSLKSGAWAAALGWICFACVTGRGGFVNWFLSNSFFQVMGKLTYSIYLIHLTTLMAISAQRRYKVNIDDFQIMFDIVGVTVFCVFIGFIWMLAFESPMIVLEKFLFGRGTVKTKSENPETITTSEVGVISGKPNTSGTVEIQM